MTNRAKVDTNHAAIVAALRRVGAQVQSLAAVGNGVPDLLVAFRGAWFVMEVKDGDKPPSRRRLTPAEAEWHMQFNQSAPVWTVSSIDEALEAIEAL